MHQTDNRVTVSRYYEFKEGKSADAAVGKSNTFLVQYRKGMITVSLNGQLVIQAAEVDPEPYPGKRFIGMGGHYWYQETISFKNLQVRRLPATVR